VPVALKSQYYPREQRTKRKRGSFDVVRLWKRKKRREKREFSVKVRPPHQKGKKKREKKKKKKKEDLEPISLQEREKGRGKSLQEGGGGKKRQ